MNTRLLELVSNPLWAAAAALALSFPALRATSPTRVDGHGDLDAIWNDPVFKKQFIAGFGVNAEIEPRITPEEVAILEKVRPLMAGNLPKAEETLTKLMKPDCSATLDFVLGGIRFQQDKLPESLESYHKAVAKFPSFRRAWHDLGLINVRKSDHDAAIKAFTRMIELGGGDAYAYGMLGYSYSAKEDYQPSEASYRNALLLQPENTEWRLGLTRCVFKQGKFEDAAALLDVLIARYPDNVNFWVLQAHTYIGMKQPLKAAANFESVDRLGKSTVDTLDTLGDLYGGENLMDLAVRAYKRAIDLDPKQPPARSLHSAEVLSARGANAQARQLAGYIRKVMGDSIDVPERKRLLKLEARLSLAENIGGAEAATILEEVVKLDPLDGDALMLLGQYYSRLNEPDRAMLYYERAAGIEAFEVNARVRQAQVLVSLGRYTDALPLLRRAQEVKPREDVARYLEQIERIAKAKR